MVPGLLKGRSLQSLSRHTIYLYILYICTNSLHFYGLYNEANPKQKVDIPILRHSLEGRLFKERQRFS